MKGNLDSNTIKVLTELGLLKLPQVNEPTFESEILSADQACDYLGIRRTKLWQIRKSDPAFPNSIFPGKLMYRKADLAKWVKAKTSKSISNF